MGVTVLGGMSLALKRVALVMSSVFLGYKCGRHQAMAASTPPFDAILCLRWFAKSTWVCESTRLMTVFGIHPLRSKLSNQVNFVLFGSSALGRITIQVGPFSALTNPFCSGIPGCWVDIPARKHVDPLRLAQRTLTKSRGPTTFPGVSPETSCVIIVSWPIFWRTWEGPKLYWIPNISTVAACYIMTEDCKTWEDRKSFKSVDTINTHIVVRLTEGWKGSC